MADSGGGSLPGPQYRVNPAGSDTADGVTTPWRTIEGARQRVRQLLGVTRAAQLNVIVDPGEYWSPLNFDPGDGGLGFSARWTISGAPGSVKVYGGAPVSDWVLHSGSIYKTRTSGRVTVLWENGTRATMARSPGYVNDGTHPLAFAAYKTTEGVAGSFGVVQYQAGDFSPAGWDTNSTRVCIWPGGGGRAWFKDSRPISSVNVGARQLTLSGNTTYEVFQGTGCRFYIEGDLSFLAGAGQFVSRLEGNQWWLYYWPNATPIGSQQIVIPAAANAISFQGDSLARPITNLTIDGWEIAYADSVYSFASNLADYAARDRGIVRMQYARNITLSRCNVRNGGNNGIQIIGAARGCTIDRTWVHSTGAHGIRIDNFPGIAPDEGDVNGGHLLQNFKVSNCGEIFGTGGVYLFNVGSCLLDRFEVSDVPRGCVEVNSGGGLGSKNYNWNNRIQYGKALRGCQDSGDMGLFYNGQTEHRPNYWNQIIGDTSSAHATMTDPEPPHGFMYDDNGDNADVRNAQMISTQGTQMHNHSGGVNTEVNCSWNGGFTGVDTANIGVTGAFPVFV